MSDPEELVDEFDEWDLVDVKKSKSYASDSPRVTAINTKEKQKQAAKKEDVDNLKFQIAKQLELKNKKDEENLINLQKKMKEQQQISEYTLLQIQQKLNEIAQLQVRQTEEQKKQTKHQSLLSKQQKELSKKIETTKKDQQNIGMGLPFNNSLFSNVPNFLWSNNQQIGPPPIQQTYPPQPRYPDPLEEKSNIKLIKNDIEDEFDVCNPPPNSLWQCPSCNENNDETNKFCPKCGCKNDLFSGTLFGDDEDEEDDTEKNEQKSEEDVPSNSVLKFMNVVGDNIFLPNEKKQYGWILKNETKSTLKLNCLLELVGSEKNIIGLKVIKENEYEFLLKPGEEIYILIEVVAPCLAGKYNLFYQLVSKNNSNHKISNMLELVINVKPKFDKKKEDKIESIIKMGFDDRKKVEYSLTKHKWNLQEAINEMIGQ